MKSKLDEIKDGQGCFGGKSCNVYQFACVNNGKCVNDITNLCNRLQIACRLQLVDTLTLGFTISGTLGHWAFAATTTHSNPEYYVT